MAKKHTKDSSFIPSEFPTVTQYEDEFVKIWNDNTAQAVGEVLKYLAAATASSIKDGGSGMLFKGVADDDFSPLKLDDIEKARNVGDLLSYNGKVYVWVEYQPGKFDWRVYQKTRVLKGKGVNGKHGLSALKHVYSEIDKTFADKDKINLKRTPKGHWRLFYDSQDTGMVIDGNAITESELQNDDICYQKKKAVDNFEMIKKYMEFESSDDVYFVQVIKRWKDNKDKPGADKWKAAGKAKGSYRSGGEYLEYYLVHNAEELEDIKSEIIKSCSYNNARAYISINSRNEKESNIYIQKFKQRVGNPNDPRYKNAEPIVYGMAKSGSAWKDTRLKVLLDIDTTRDNEVTISGKKVNIWKEVEKRLKGYNIKIAAEYETPSGGLHFILNNKNNRNLKPFFEGLKDFDGGMDLGRLATVHPSEDIKMVLYSNVDTEGY